MPGVYSDTQVTEYIDRFRGRFQRIEAQLVLLSEKLGVPFESPSAGLPADVVELALSGNRLAAATRYRELTGASGREAQEAIAQI